MNYNYGIPIYTRNITNTEKDNFIISSITDTNRDWFYDLSIKDTYKINDVIKDVITLKMCNDGNSIHINTFINNLSFLCDKYHINQEIGLILQHQKNYNKESSNVNPFIYTELNDGETILEINYICEYYNNFLASIGNEKKIPIEFFEELFDIESPGQPVMGKGECLLIFINPFPKKIKGGDVTLNEYITAEVKNLSVNEAQLGNHDKGNVKPIFNFLSVAANNDITPQTISISTRVNRKNISILEALNKLKNIDDKYLYGILKTSINDEFYFHDKIMPNIHIHDNVIRKAITEFKKDFEHKNFIRFIRIVTALYAVIYCREENSDVFSFTDVHKNFHFYKVNDDLFDKIMLNDAFPIFKIRYSSGKNLVNIKF